MTTKHASSSLECICDYCGAKRDTVMFCIGASPEPDWTMHEGTGKMTCPDCWEQGRKDARDAIDRHLAAHSKADTEAQKTYLRPNDPRYGRTTTLVEKATGRTLAVYMGCLSHKAAFENYANGKC